MAIATIAAATALAGCSHAPTAPTPPPSPPQGIIAIASIAVDAAADGAGGYTYRVVLQLTESGGVAASIGAVDLAFMDGSTLLVASRHDRPLADSPMVPANATVSTRELETVDANPAHTCALSVRATVTFNSGTAGAGTATAVAAVPPPPRTYTLTGVVSDAATGRAIEGATVTVLDGPDAGKSSVTTAAGNYSIPGLNTGSLTIQAKANAYDTSSVSVTLAEDTRLDLKLRRTDTGPTPPGPTACVYTMSPIGGTHLSEYGGAGSIAISRTAGTCGWQATSNVAWITLGSASGGGSATLSYTVGLNVGFAVRTGVISVAWAGGSLQLTITQDGNINPFCLMFIRVNGESAVSVGAAGGRLVATIAPLLPTPPGACGAWTATATPPISFVGAAAGRGPGGLTFSVPSNGSPTERSMQVTVEYLDPVNLRQTSLTVRQAGAP